MSISPDLLVQSLRGNTIEHRQIGVEHHLLTTDEEDRALNALGWNKGTSLRHGTGIVAGTITPKEYPPSDTAAFAGGFKVTNCDLKRGSA